MDNEQITLLVSAIIVTAIRLTIAISLFAWHRRIEKRRGTEPNAAYTWIKLFMIFWALTPLDRGLQRIPEAQEFLHSPAAIIVSLAIFLAALAGTWRVARKQIDKK